jgi:phosphoribosylanthranilate isomerase
VIKAARVATAADLRDLDRFHTDYHLLDTAQAGAYGGTGHTWDWSLVKQRRSKTPFLLAGGLNPDNVAEAIEATRPWGIDVSSGVEAAYGVKDHDKLRALFAAVGTPPEGNTAARDRVPPEVLVYPPREDDESAREAARRPGGAVSRRGRP